MWVIWFLNITAVKREAPDQPWHCILASTSDSHVLTGMLYALHFCQAILPGTKTGFELNYILFELENSYWRIFLSVTMKSVFSFHHPTNIFTQKFVRIRSFVCNVGTVCGSLSSLDLVTSFSPEKYIAESFLKVSETTLKWEMVKSRCIIAIRCFDRLERGQRNSLCWNEQNFQYFQYYYDIIWFWNLFYKGT